MRDPFWRLILGRPSSVCSDRNHLKHAHSLSECEEEDFHLSDRRLSSLTSALTRPSPLCRLPNADCVRVRVYVTVQLDY